jgi:hypothetical protein
VFNSVSGVTVMGHSLLRIVGAAGVAGAAFIGAPHTPAFAATSKPVPAPVPAAAPGSPSTVVSLKNTGSPAKRQGAQDVCFFSTKGDYVHISSSAFEASGHGWWVNGDCPATLAVVTVQLQEYYSDGRWRNKGTVGKKTVRSGGGAGNRATGRGGCNNHGTAGWRSVIDVDLVGVADDPRKLTTPARNIGCTRL